MQTLSKTPTLRPPSSALPRQVRCSPHGEVMSACGVALLPQLPVSTMYCLAAGGSCPGRRLGRACRFLRSRLPEHLDAKHAPLSPRSARRPPLIGTGTRETTRTFSDSTASAWSVLRSFGCGLAGVAGVERC